MANNRPTPPAKPTTRPTVSTYQATKPSPLSPIIAVVGSIIAIVMIVLLIVGRPNPQGANTGAPQVAGAVTSAAPVSASGVRAPSAQCQGVTGAEVASPETVTTASGLQYQVLREGTADGGRPTATTTVTVNYEGRLESGSVFDSSYQRGQPATFPLNGVIAGWTEGVQLMSRCALYRFTIPGDLAYGPEGRPPTIPPNATLIFDIELISF